MTPAETLLAEATQAGVRLYLDRGEVHFQAVPGALTPNLLARLREARPALTALLSGVATPVAEKSTPRPVVRRPARLPEDCPRCKGRTRWLPLTYPGRFLCYRCWAGFGADYPPGGAPPDPDPTTPCHCTSTRFWRSPAGVVRCAVCSPPASPLHATWLELNTERSTR